MRPVDFLGNFYMNNTTEMIFGTLDADKSVCVELKHDDKLNADSQFYVQVTLSIRFVVNRVYKNKYG